MVAHGVMFHHFHDDCHAPGQGSIGAGELVAMIESIGRKKILPAHEWLERAGRNMLQADDICLTFDDSLRCQFDIAVPVLRDLNISAFFFVHTLVLSGQLEMLEVYRHFRMTRFRSVEAFYEAFYEVVAKTSNSHRVRQALLRFNPREYLSEYAFYTAADRKFRFVRDEVLGPEAYHAVMQGMVAAHEFDAAAVGRRLWMNSEQIRQLHSEGHVIGLHSHTHPARMKRLSPQQQRDEYYENFRYVRHLTGVAPRAMSHPGNSYSPYTLAILRQLGIRIGFRANMAQQDYCPLELPREDHSNLIARSVPASAVAA